MAIDNTPSDQSIDGVRGREVTPEEIARRDGYVKGRNDENYQQQSLRSQERVVAQSRENDSAASGMVFGLLIALLAAGVGAAFYFLSGDRTAPVAIPQIQKEKVIEKETTVIEKEASEPPAVSLPDVRIETPDINVTNETPPAESAPAVEPSAPTSADPAAESSVEPAATEPPAEPAN
ncbi:MAG: hypothetical protein WA885_15420 [Phormidesmis sp.]